MTALIDLLARAHAAGLQLSHGEDDTLRVRGSRSAEAIVRELLERKEAVLTTLSVYNGTAPRLDWRKGRILDRPQPCVLCGKATILLEPYDDRPCHKGCAEAAIRQGTAPSAKAKAA
jgi:Fe-S-cluster-containing hydrogenase component 2